MSEHLTRYHRAAQKLAAAEKDALQMVKVIGEVNQAGQGWRSVAYRGGRLPAGARQLLDPPNKWPTWAELTASLVAYQDAKDETQAAYNSVPDEEKAILRPPQG